MKNHGNASVCWQEINQRLFFRDILRFVCLFKNTNKLNIHQADGKACLNGQKQLLGNTKIGVFCTFSLPVAPRERATVGFLGGAPGTFPT